MLEESPAESGDVLMTSCEPLVIIMMTMSMMMIMMMIVHAEDDKNDDGVRKRLLLGCGDLLITS